MATPRLALLGCTLAATLSGCVSIASLQDWQYELANKGRANEAWLENHTYEQREQLGCDYEAGYKAGFVDTAIGRDCRVPPVAPPKYWSAKYQCCEGQARIQDWFRGYQCGIASAEACGFAEFHEVPTSVTAPVVNKTACGKCQVGDFCRCSPTQEIMLSPHLSQAIPKTSGDAAREETPQPDVQHVVPASLGMIGPVDLSATSAQYRHTPQADTSAQPSAFTKLQMPKWLSNSDQDSSGPQTNGR